MTDFFNPRISNHWIVISVDNSDVARGKQRGRLASKGSEGTRNFPLWFVMVQLYNLGKSFVCASVLKFLGV